MSRSFSLQDSGLWTDKFRNCKTDRQRSTQDDSTRLVTKRKRNLVKESHGREILSTRAQGKDNIQKVVTELDCDCVKRTVMVQDRTQGHAMGGQVYGHRLLWKVLSAPLFAVTQTQLILRTDTS